MTARTSLTEPVATSATWRGSAFGLEIETNRRIPGLGRWDGSGRRVLLETVERETIERGWRVKSAHRLLERRFPDGRPMMTVDSHAALGYRIWAPSHGTHVVSPDGTYIRSALPRVSAWQWQRLLFAQVLPLAAALQGVDLFHASAAAFDGRVVALVGPPGAGKTSVAVQLVGEGATLVTDDVLALVPGRDRILALPGAAFANVDPSELAGMSASGRRRLGKEVGRTDKVHVAARIAEEAFPLQTVYLLDRGGTELQFDRDSDASSASRMLLGSSFITYLRSPLYLMSHLEICARIASSVDVARVRIPGTVSARAVASAIHSDALDRT
jgi:hypothetical protein